jgi:hypothetical protein
MRRRTWSARRESPPWFDVAVFAISVRRGQQELEEQVSSAALASSVPFFACHGCPLLVSFLGVTGKSYGTFGAKHSSHRCPATRISRIREGHTEVERIGVRRATTDLIGGTMLLARPHHLKLCDYETR